jgi:Holliday junction DNA helicase RuvA
VIGYLKGFIKAIHGEAVIVTVGGVGYEVYVSQQTLTTLTGDIEAELWIYTHVREDQLVLYGFLSPAEKQLFLSLLKVNGIGPKVAIKILSAAPTREIINMIDQGDVKSLSSLPKVGKKTAEQIILELKGKLIQLDSVAAPEHFSVRADIVSALVNLGFKLSDVEKVVQSFESDIDLQAGVRRGLQALASQI